MHLFQVWREDGPTGGQCIWESHGVWGYDNVKKEGVVLKETYFTRRPSDGGPVRNPSVHFEEGGIVLNATVVLG